MNKIFLAFCLIFLSTILQFAASEECAYAKDTLQAEYGEIIYAGLVSFLRQKVLFPKLKHRLVTMRQRYFTTLLM